MEAYIFLKIFMCIGNRLEDINLDFILLTKTVGNIPVISLVYSWLVELMGMIMSLIFEATSSLGIFNLGLCIILFTIITRILMFPLSYRQSRSQKLMSAVQPEITAIQNRYKGRDDQQSMMAMQAETRAVYDRYGVSMTGGCLQLLIQMPILFSLYRVIINIPAYVPSVKQYFQNIVDAIGGASAIQTVNTYAHSSEALTKVLSQARIAGSEITTTDNIIDFLYHLEPSQWDGFRALFTNAANVIDENYVHIEQMNNFLGLNLATAPSSYGLTNPVAWIIPILAGLSQFAASRLMMKINNNQAASDEDNPTARTMRSMNLMMPIISVVFCFGFASGIGVYWVASSVLMMVQQIILNKMFEKVDTKELVRQNVEKVNKKRAKRGLPPISEKTSEENLKRMQEKAERTQALLDAKKTKAQENLKISDDYYSLTSISDRAKMVQQYEEKKKKKK